MKSSLTYLIVFLLCIVARLLTSVNYVEDYETLSFFLGFQEYNFPRGTPPFPGYPILYAVVGFFTYVTGSLSTSFSLVGGISTFIIIYYTSRILRISLFSLEGGLTGFLLFFNANIWLMGNKFLPDLIGMAFVMPIVYYFLIDNFRPRYVYKGWILAGLLPGVMLSFVPLIIIPSCYVLYKRKNYYLSLPLLILGISAWLLPLLLYTGIDKSLTLSWSYLNAFVRGWDFRMGSKSLMMILEAIWAEGLAGYIPSRNLLTIFTSVGNIAFIFFGVMITMSFGHNKKKLLIALASMFIFLLSTYFLRSTENMHRHILPFIPFLTIFICYGMIYFLVNFNAMAIKVICLLYMLIYTFINLNLVSDHTQPTAIAALKNYIFEKGESPTKKIISYPEINSYLYYSGIHTKYETLDQLLVTTPTNTYIILPAGYPAPSGFSKVVKKEHNPLVNRKWPELNLYIYP